MVMGVSFEDCLRGPDGVFWKDSDYHKQKELENKNPVFKRKQGGRR